MEMQVEHQNRGVRFAESKSDFDRKDVIGEKLKEKVEQLSVAFSVWNNKVKEWCALPAHDLSNYEEDIKVFISFLHNKVDLLQSVNLRQFMNEAGFGAQLVHDIKNAATPIEQLKQLSKIEKFIKEDPGYFQEDLALFWSSFFLYVNIFEDVNLKFLYGEHLPKDYPLQPLDLELLGKSLFLDGETQGLISDRENVPTASAVVVNGLANIISNSKKIKATKVTKSVSREGDTLVIRVVDDGIGLKEEQLKPESLEFIFRLGVSGTGSTGLGLGNLTVRLEEVGGHVVVYSRSKNENKNGFYKYTSDSKGGSVEQAGSLPINEPDVSTIFEIRLPITKIADDEQEITKNAA